jgi:hypothetical protein
VQNELHLRYIHIVVQTEQHSDDIVQTELHLRYIHKLQTRIHIRYVHIPQTELHTENMVQMLILIYLASIDLNVQFSPTHIFMQASLI